ncbi:MAG: MarR family winged helix-turn-helix transcriptional regulator [Eggerthellaceae bacterium]
MQEDRRDSISAALFLSLHDLHRTQVRAALKLQPEKTQLALEAISRDGVIPLGGPLAHSGRAADVEAMHGPEGEDGIAVSELARILRSSLPATSRLLGTLERRGLVTRRQDPADRRKTLVTLTDAGRRERDRGRSLFVEYARLIAGDFGEERMEAFSREADQLAAAMRRALDAMGQRHPNLTGDDPVRPLHCRCGDTDAYGDTEKE